MVFYESILPTELWFIIYKIEHMNKLKLVNKEILSQKKNKIRKKYIEFLNIYKYIEFNNFYNY